MTAPTPEQMRELAERTVMSDHFPDPGPGYWDWRCLRCDQPVRHHSLQWFTFWKKGWWTR